MKNEIKLLSIIVVFFLFSFMAASVVFAFAPEEGPGIGPTSVQTLVNVINYIAKFVYFLGLVMAIIMIVWSGITWMTSGGDEEKVKKARTRFIYALIGFAVVLFSWAAQRFITSFWGVS